MFSIRSRHVPHPVQAPVALDTASTVAAPLSIAVLTLSLVTARQIHANTPSLLLTRADLVWLGYPNFAVGETRSGIEKRRPAAAGSVSE
jgi:hypothetical protein